MKAMRDIIDTWNMIEEYKLEGYKVLSSGTVLVPEEEYNRLMDSVVNKKYIKNLTW